MTLDLRDVPASGRNIRATDTAFGWEHALTSEIAARRSSWQQVLELAGLYVQFSTNNSTWSDTTSNSDTHFRIASGTEKPVNTSNRWSAGIALASGTSGSDGADGTDGVDGADGTNGADGADGADGNDGATGATGPAGTMGAAGQQGADGADGATGATGSAGTQGVDGTDGTDGADGTNGTDGATGPAGAMGADGADGATGADGPQGPAGSSGSFNWQDEGSDLAGVATVNIVGDGATGVVAGTVLTITIPGGGGTPAQMHDLICGWSADAAISDAELSAGAMSTTNTVTIPTATGTMYLFIWRADADGGDPLQVTISGGLNVRNTLTAAVARTVDSIPGQLLVGVQAWDAGLNSSETLMVV